MGSFVNGLKNGPGKLHYDTGDIWFEGTFKDDKFHGSDCKIYYTSGKLKYEGEMIAGKKEGRGTLSTTKGRVYATGLFVNDKLETKDE